MISSAQFIFAVVAAIIVTLFQHKAPFSPSLTAIKAGDEKGGVNKDKSPVFQEGDHCPLCKRRRLLAHQFEFATGHSLWREFVCPKCGIVAQQPIRRMI